jgi:hypothetical protein
MVSCIKCGKRLLNECECNIPWQKRVEMFINSSTREVNLIKEIRKGFIPTITIGKERINPTVKWLSDFEVELYLTIKPLDWRKVRIITLLDVENKPLYRKFTKDWGCSFRKGDTMDLNWKLKMGE